MTHRVSRLVSGSANHKTPPAETQYGCGCFSRSEKRKTRRSLWTEVVSQEVIFKSFQFRCNVIFLSYCSHERQTGDRWMGRLKGGPTNHKRSPAETQYGCGDFSPSEKRKTRRSLWTEVVSLAFIFKMFISMKNKRRALLHSI